MTARTSEIGIKRRLEIDDAVAKIMRLLVDMVVEDKRAVVTEIDRLVAFEESSHVAEGKQH